MSVMNGKGLAVAVLAVWFAGCWLAGDAYEGGARVAYALGRMADPVGWLVVGMAWLVLAVAFRRGRRPVN